MDFIIEKNFLIPDIFKISKLTCNTGAFQLQLNKAKNRELWTSNALDI